MVAHKIKPFPWISKGSPLFSLSQSCAFIMAANWVMQGMRGMDRGELAFRGALFAVFAVIFSGMGANTLISVLAAHSLNFAFNGHPWVCLRYCAFYRRSPESIENWLDDWSCRLDRLGWLREAVIIGSRAKRMLSNRSDIDLRLVTPPGFLNWLLTNLLLLIMRSHALLKAIPLDLYTYDAPASLRRFDQNEPMAILLDRDQRMRLLFADRTLIEL